MDSVEIRGNKSTGDLLREAGWFVAYTGIAVLSLAVVMAAIGITHPDPDAAAPKILGTALAFVLPLLVGLVIAKFHPDYVAPQVWISGFLFFLIICVYVLDLPTGNGLCNGCGAIDKLWRTFFSIDHGSGLMAGDGLVFGTWIPLSMIGYAVGAKVSSATTSE